MYNFKMWLANYMRGRYGTDDLNKFLLLASLVLIVLNMFIRWRFIHLAIVLMLILIYARMFSRNINARYRENQKFLEFVSRFRKGRGPSAAGGGAFSGFGAARDKDHKVLRCPGCGSKLRVPKGAGNIMINCPHCGTKFKKKV